MTNSPSSISVRDQLLEKIRADQSLPTLGVFIAKVIEITSSEEDSVSELAHFILSDVALTQQILRVANTIQYKTTGNAVTTISRAIFLLGFDTIKSHALATLLVDGFKNKKHAHFVRKELVQALCASMTAREVAQKNVSVNREEVAVAALFKNIGRVLVAAFDHEMYEQIQTLTSHNALEDNDICSGILGCSFQRFGGIVLHDWHIPESIIQATQNIPASELKKTSNKQEWIKQVANFSEDLAFLIVNVESNNPSTIAALYNLLLKKYSRVLEFDNAYLDKLIEKIRKQTHELSVCFDVMVDSQSNMITSDVDHTNFCDEFMLPAFDTRTLHTQERHPSGKPINARDLLLSGIQDATQMITSEQIKLNDLILLVLETLYTAMGFQFATACLRDIKKSQYTAKLSVGEHFQERQKLFHFSTIDDHSIFHLAMNNNVDLMIADAQHEKIQKMLPAWHKSLLPTTQSFIILPLVIDNKPIGFFYADRNLKATEGVPPDETALIKMLKGLLLNAMLKK